MTGNVPSAEPDPQQLHLSDDSEEKVEDGEEEEKATTEDNPMHNGMPTMTSFHSMNINSPQNQANTEYQLSAENQDWLDRQTPKEMKVPRVLNGIVSSSKLFRAAHKIYKEE